MDRFHQFNSGRANFFLLVIITCVLCGAVLKITASLVLPFTISLFLVIAITPLLGFLEKLRIPRFISILLILAFFAGVLVSVGMVLVSSSSALVNLYPRYEARLTEIYVWVARFFELPYNEHLSFFENLWGQLGIRSHVRGMALSFSNWFISFLSDAFMVALFMLFLLIEASFFREKLDRAFDGTRAIQIKKIISDLMSQVTHYLSIKFVISLATGVFVGIGLKIVGLEFAVVWGVIQFVLNFIPNIGSIAVGVAATGFAVIQFWPNPMPIMAVAFIMLITNMILGSILEPKIMGDRLGLSPLVVLVTLMLWGWIWGFAGLILAVPMTAIIKIVCENVPVLEPISIIMGSGKAAAKSESSAASQPTDDTPPPPPEKGM